MPKALSHTYPRLDYPPGCEVGNDDPREVWEGAMRVVSPRRARKLRKRGVPLMPLHAVRVVPDGVDGCGVSQHRVEPLPNQRARYAWFVPEPPSACCDGSGCNVCGSRPGDGI